LAGRDRFVAEIIVTLEARDRLRTLDELDGEFTSRAHRAFGEYGAARDRAKRRPTYGKATRFDCRFGGERRAGRHEPRCIDIAIRVIITTSTAPRLSDWPCIIDGKAVTLRMHGQLRASSTSITQEMALAGLGMCRIRDLTAALLAQRRELIEALDKFTDQQNRAGVCNDAARTPPRTEDPRMR
jgi:hypothetical protein